MPPGVLSRVLLVVATLASWLSGLGVDFDSMSTPCVAPRPVAFGIWIVIYVALMQHGVFGTLGTESTVAACISLLLTVAWATTVAASRSVAALFLVASTLGAWLAVHASSPRPPVGFGLYAGWLSVAATLAFAQAFPFLDHPSVLVVPSLLLALAAAPASSRVGIVLATLMQRTWSPWHVPTLILAFTEVGTRG